MLKERWERALPFERFLETAQSNVELWQALYRRARVSPTLLAQAQALRTPWHLLVLSEDWCGDAVNTVPLVARLAQLAGNLELRVLARDQNLDLMDTHLTGTSRSIPVIMALDGDFVEHGWWGPRPAELQAWFLAVGKALEKAERYREIRTWYARDRGVSTLTEVIALLEQAEQR